MTTNSLDFDPASLALAAAYFIGGRLYVPDEEVISVVRPSDGEWLGHIPDATVETVDFAVRNAVEALKANGWGTRPPRERGRVLARWVALIDADAENLSKLEAASSPRPVVSSDGESAKTLAPKPLRHVCAKRVSSSTSMPRNCLRSTYDPH